MSRTREEFEGGDAFADGHEESDNSRFVDQIDLQHYLRLVRKHRWLIILFTALVTALASYYAFTATPVYRSTSTLLIESQQTNIISVQELIGVDAENQDYYETQFELLRSRGLAIRVIEHLDLWNHPELAPTQPAPDGAIPVASGEEAADAEGWLGAGTAMLERIGLDGGSDPAGGGDALDDVQRTETPVVRGDGLLDEMPVDVAVGAELLPEEDDVLNDPAKLLVVSNFMSRLAIQPVRKTKLVKIHFSSTDPAFAAKVANAVGEQYITSYLDARMELTTKASRWLNGRLTTLKEILDESERRLIDFKRENGLVDVDGSVGRLNEQELLLVTAELTQARSDLSGAADLYRETQALADQPELLESLPSVQADPLVQNSKIQKGQAQRELDELRNRYGERHPRVIDAQSRLASIDATLQGHLNRVVGSIAKDYQLARQRVASIEAELSSGKDDIQALGSKKFELDSLEREVITNREIYGTFFSRMTEAKSADGLEAANARITDAAVIPRAPIKPNKQLIIALAALGSLGLSVLMAILYEQLDDTVRATSDVEDKLGMELIGILPLIKSGLLSRKRDLPLNPLEVPDKKGTFAESVKTARTALSVREGNDPKKIVMVTSSVPGEGKSTTAINLAYSFSQLERVLLIDCDMRRPSIAKAAGLERDVEGLSSVIMRTAQLRNCIRHGAFDGALDLLPSGPIPEQPLELLSSLRFGKMLEKLGQRYDRIILDCAPTQAVSDAMILSRLSDAVIYVVKSHETSMDLVRRGIQRLRQVKAPVAGVLVTQVDIEKIVSFGGDYYYQGYYDYYGYSDKDSSKTVGGGGGGKLRLSQEELLALRRDESDFDLELDSDLFERQSASAGNRSDAGERGVSFDEADRREDYEADRREDYETDRRENYETARNGPRRGGRVADDLDII